MIDFKDLDERLEALPFQDLSASLGIVGLRVIVTDNTPMVRALLREQGIVAVDYEEWVDTFAPMLHKYPEATGKLHYFVSQLGYLGNGTVDDNVVVLLDTATKYPVSERLSFFSKVYMAVKAKDKAYMLRQPNSKRTFNKIKR